MFHYLFPPLTIGLGIMLVVLEGMYLKTKNPQYEIATRFWTKIFALNFAMGVVTGIVMEFEFGTNWASYSRFVGDVFGSALAAEGIFAFFLESGFLAVLVFGWNHVSPRMHFFSTIMVALGSIFSSIWIVVANSWQQTPAGYHIVENVINGRTQIRAEITDFWELIFNPSTIHRLIHVWIGAFILGAFFVMSITAYYLLKNKHQDFAKKSFSAALLVAVVASMAALVSGHFQAQNVYDYQPAKLAAFEGLFETESDTPLTIFGIPDECEQKMKYAVEIPCLLSFMVHHNFYTPVVGLDHFPEDERPPVAICFHSYHIMVGLGMFFIVLTLLALFLHWRGSLYRQRWLLWIFVFAVVGPYIANELGWVAAEVGRQPWTVYGELKTSDSLSTAVGANEVLASMIMFGLIYVLLFMVFIYILDDKIKQGPEPVGEPAAEPERFLDTAARLAAPNGESLTEAHDRPTDSGDDKD
jgi:cytochrome d ubiquinol oxidase subunit I